MANPPVIRGGNEPKNLGPGQTWLGGPPVPMTLPHYAPPPGPGGIPNKPLWQMTPAELQAMAMLQAKALYEPSLNEYHYQQSRLEKTQRAAEMGMQALITALQGSVGNAGGNYADIFREQIGNAGLADVLAAKQQYANQGEDILHSIAGLQQDIANKASDIYGGFQNSIADYRTAQQKQANADRNYALSAQRVALSAAKQLSDATGQLYVPGPNGPVLATGKDGKPISTEHMSPYQVASLQARAAAQQSTNAYRQAQLGLSQQRVDQGQQRLNQSKTGVKPPSAAVIRKGWSAISDSYYHAPGSSKRLTDADIQKKLDAVNQSSLAFNDKHGLKEGDDKYRPPLTLDNISRMTDSQKRVLGIAGSSRNPQDVYMDLVHSGIPARRAWTMVRKSYPDWGKGYFPKGSAAETAAVKGRVPKNQAAKYIVGEAEKWLGTPYSWGGGGPGGPSYGIGRGAKTKGFDCSGFIEYLYSKYGIEVGGVTYEQIKHGYSVKGQPYQPGDLIFFGTAKDPHHVGMYIGGNKFIESPYTGGHIQITSLNTRKDIVDVRRIFA